MSTGALTFLLWSERTRTGTGRSGVEEHDVAEAPRPLPAVVAEEPTE